PNGCNANLSRPGNILLAPAKERAGCTELCHLKHFQGGLFDSSHLTNVLFFIASLLVKLYILYDKRAQEGQRSRESGYLRTQRKFNFYQRRPVARRENRGEA